MAIEFAVFLKEENDGTGKKEGGEYEPGVHTGLSLCYRSTAPVRKDVDLLPLRIMRCPVITGDINNTNKGY